MFVVKRGWWGKCHLNVFKKGKQLHIHEMHRYWHTHMEPLMEVTLREKTKALRCNYKPTHSKPLVIFSHTQNYISFSFNPFFLSSALSSVTTVLKCLKRRWEEDGDSLYSTGSEDDYRCIMHCLSRKTNVDLHYFMCNLKVSFLL